MKIIISIIILALVILCLHFVLSKKEKFDVYISELDNVLNNIYSNLQNEMKTVNDSIFVNEPGEIFTEDEIKNVQKHHCRHPAMMGNLNIPRFINENNIRIDRVDETVKGKLNDLFNNLSNKYVIPASLNEEIEVNSTNMFDALTIYFATKIFYDPEVNDVHLEKYEKPPNADNKMGIILSKLQGQQSQLNSLRTRVM